MDKRKIFKRFLESRGLRFTSERRKVLEGVSSVPKHFEADDLFVGMRQDGHRVSKATIYRTLALLVQCGLLREVIFRERQSYYERVFGRRHHHHLICMGCGKIVEFVDETIERLPQRVCEEHRFEPIEHSFEITGYCEKCAKRLRDRGKAASRDDKIVPLRLQSSVN